MTTRCLVMALLTLVCAAPAAEIVGKATLYRDRWGVPHIYATTPTEGAYALGYAQAEDRLEDIFQALRTGLGRMAEAYGESFVDQDYIMRICRNEEMSKKAWPQIPPERRDMVRAFQAGIEAYMAEHPEKVPASKLTIEPWMFETIGRAMILRWPLGAIQDDLGNRKKIEALPETSPAKETNIPMRSNEWAVAPSRTTTGGPILHADPHLTWEGLAVLYEARVHAGELHMCGFFLIGTPLMGYGHTDKVAWANTTGGPDTADVYEMKVKPGLVPQYEYDGAWKTPRIIPQRIAVKGQEKPVIRPSALTHLGPVVAPIENGVAYVGATPYFEKTRLFDQFLRMNLADNAREFYDALGMLEYNEQNVMFADTAGTIAYVRNGATPIRPDGYDWSAPVPGNTSKTAWKDIHPIDDLVQIFDPPAGYMQNCNIGPAAMMVDSPLTHDKFKKYIYNVGDWENNPRGDRSRQLLHADSQVTKEDAFAYAMDVYDLKAALWQKALRDALAGEGKQRSENPTFAQAVKAILAWDGQWTVDATPTVLIRQWREFAAGKPELTPMADNKPLDAAGQKILLDALERAIQEITSRHGRWDIPWGDVYVIGRGGKFFPMPGADFGNRRDDYNYTETLLSISYKPDPENPSRQVAFKGSMAMILMFVHPDGIESYSACAWGQSAEPASPHYMDQGEKLFSKRQLKPTFWKKDDLLKNLESEKTLEVKVLSDE